MPCIESPVFNLSVYEENGEVVDQNPFIIRGHHLRTFAGLKDILPTKLAEYANTIEPIVKENREYAQDVLGLSFEYIDEYKGRIKQIYETFLSLPDDHPAEIVEGIPDIICGACAIGKHCKTNGLKGDSRYVGKFILALDDLNLPKPTITQELTYFSDTEPQQARRIKTTIGTIRQVLKQTDPKIWS